MGILKNNGDLKDLFRGLYEQGSEGKNAAAPAAPGMNTGDGTKSRTVSINGYIREAHNRMWLEAEGGLIFQLSFKNALAPADLFSGKLITVTGIQQADTILNAVVSEVNKPVKVAIRKSKIADPSMVPLAASVKKFLERYKNKTPGLLTARPGYKFVDGQLTAIPAIEVVVEKKINLASLDKTHTLPDKFENYDVEVVSASPKDLLIHKLAKESAEAAIVARYIPPTLLESLVLDEARPAGLQESATLESAEVTSINYNPPTSLKLEEVTGAMTLLCHVSPEGGWKTLGPFLDDVTESLEVAMYDFSAPQIYATLKTIARRGTPIKLVYDGNSAAGVGQGTKTDDVKEDTIINGIKRIAGKNFEYVKAWKGKGGLCANAYHIKVAIKDKKEFWLSSGNWQSSNQPNEDFENNINLLPKYNREWNVLVNNKKLADTYRKFIDWDFKHSQDKTEAEMMELVLPEMYLPEAELETREVARYMLFPPKKFVFTAAQPVRVQPVLTPDNYLDHALAVIKSARQKLYFQNQYIKISNDTTPQYEELLNELRDKTNDNGIDCRIILRTERTDDTRAMLDDLQAYGFNMSKVKVMTNTHTKGIIADSETIMIGSHNWSNFGVQFNRDASLVIYNAGVAQYYEDVFLHDWDRRTQKHHDEEITILPKPGTETEALMETDNLVPLDWKSYLE